MRSIVARCLCVQRHISLPVPQSFKRCDKVSVCPQWVQRGESARAILWRRSFVGRISCIAMYHKDRTVSGIQGACKLLQKIRLKRAETSSLRSSSSQTRIHVKARRFQGMREFQSESQLCWTASRNGNAELCWVW